MPSASRSPLVPLLPALLLAALPAAAQDAGQTIIDRATQPAAVPAPLPAAETSRAAPGADTDAGTQRIAEPRALPFRVHAGLDQQFTATSNVFLSPDDETGALLSTTTVSLGLDTLPVVVGEGRLVFSAALVWQRTHHGLATADQAIDDLDFDSWSLPLSASYRWGRGWEAAAGFTVGSLYSVGDTPSHELLYRSHVASLSLRKLTRLSDGLALSTGAGISYADTKSDLGGVPALLRYRDDRNDRVDGSLHAALYAFRGPWTLVPALRLNYGHYLHWEEGGFNAQDRDDLVAGASLTLSYAFAKWGSVRAVASYDVRESSGGFVDYDYSVGGFGLGLGLGLSF
jgi:hypothetical protein